MEKLPEGRMFAAHAAASTQSSEYNADIELARHVCVCERESMCVLQCECLSVCLSGCMPVCRWVYEAAVGVCNKSTHQTL